MSARSFLDTNILVYADDGDSPEKQKRAIEVTLEQRAAGTGVLSLQVLQEYFAITTRKLGTDPDVARRKVEVLALFEVVTPTLDDLLAAIDLHRHHRISFWDALIVRAAQRSACAVLLTEDLQDGRVFDGVKVVNPFRGLTEPREA
ncbi:MAG TPA: PIN domain-containing protein [Myxococcota bacterium]|nr:PIN domain-containing protein [Myxococcota bacterium]